MTLSHFANHALPLMIDQASRASLYRVSFPEGLPHTLVALKQGEFGSMVTGFDGKFAGSASFFPVESINVVGAAFQVASFVVAQYYLTEINSQLTLINEKLDSILEFLYGDKKAELLAEMDFIRYSYHNYLSVMKHEYQRQAVLTNLQQARKVASKDIEFYLNDLDRKVMQKFGNDNELGKIWQDIEKTHDCIELSTQVYLMSVLLEIYYAQNFEADYLKYMEQDLLAVMNRCDRRMISSLSSFAGRIQAFNGGPAIPFVNGALHKEKFLNPLNYLIRTLNDNQDNELKKTLKQVMRVSSEPVQFYLQSNGEMRMVTHG